MESRWWSAKCNWFGCVKASKGLRWTYGNENSVIKDKKFETIKGKVGSFKNKIEPFAKSFGFSTLKDEESKKRPVANTPHFHSECGYGDECVGEELNGFDNCKRLGFVIDGALS